MGRRWLRIASAAALLLCGSLPLAAAGRGSAQISSLPRVSFRAAAGASMLVQGTYPAVHTVCVRHSRPLLRARFNGTIEVGKDTDGRLFVIQQVPLERYLTGLAEMPRTWPLEALKAQAIAARSYALAHIRYGDPTGRRLGYQLCATDACQVYLGLGIADGPYGTRWRRAVSQTAGQVLLYNGFPADALYFSTSNGRTYGNETVFGAAPLPYLRPVVERDDGGSPLSHWRVAMPLRDVGRFLGAAGAWPGGAVTRVRLSASIVTVSRPGLNRRLSVSDFRNDVNTWSHCLDPTTYPGTNLVDGTTVPQTIPSKWLSLATDGGSLVVTGRGWGHGVGMVQWGAEGKATRGLTAPQILSFYYGGLRPVSFAGPAAIRVGIATGLTSVAVVGQGPVMASRTAAGPGPWLVTGGKTLTVKRGSPPPPPIGAGTLAAAPSGLRSGASFTAELRLPQLSVVRLVIRRDGRDAPLGEPITYQAGTVRVPGRLPPDLPSGTYPLQAVVTDGIDYVRTPAVTLRVAGSSSEPPPSTVPPSTTPPLTATPSPAGRTPASSSPQAAAGPAERSGRSILWPAVGALLVLASVALAGLALARRSPPRR